MADDAAKPEAMRRLVAMIAAGAVAAGEEVTFSFKGARFSAVLGDDGTLRGVAADLEKQENDAPGKDPDSHKGGATGKVYASPTEFATDMAKLVLASRGVNRRQRGKLTVNGWADCQVRGKSLAALRSSMLRDARGAVEDKLDATTDDADFTPLSAERALDGQPEEKGEKKSSQDGAASTPPAAFDQAPDADAADGDVAVKAAPQNGEQKGSVPEIEELKSKDRQPADDADQLKGTNKDSANASTEAVGAGEPEPSTPPMEGRKRKRSESGTPPPASSSGSVSKKHQSERPTRGRRLEIPSASDSLPADLDPDAVEAAAVAALAEKEEASSRARRTTRLASGKIKQVDYKASASAQVIRQESGNDFEESDGDYQGQESATERMRTSSRRRAAGSIPTPPLRSSRRATRQRASQEKEYDSAGRGTPSRAGSVAINSSDDAPAANGTKSDDDMDIVDSDVKEEDATAVAENRTDTKEDCGSDQAGEAGDVGMKVDDGNKGIEKSGEGDGAAEGNSVREDGEVNEGSGNGQDDGDDEEEEEEEEEESGGDEREVNPEDRRNDHGWAIADVYAIGSAVRAVGSIEPSRIVEALRKDKSWKHNEQIDSQVVLYLEQMTESIREHCPRTSTTSDTGIRVNDVLSYLAAELWRLKAGGMRAPKPRPTAGTVAKIKREEQLRNELDKGRRKRKRELEELRGKLESEMELRRKLELDGAYLELQLVDSGRGKSRELAKRRRIEKEIEMFKLKEVDVRNRLDHTRQVIAQLRGERDPPTAATRQRPTDKLRKLGSVQRDASTGAGNGGGAIQVSGENGDMHVVVGESITSDDDAMEDVDAGDVKNAARTLEMERLRVLVAARVAEAEDYQRVCEQERARYIAVLEAKSKLEQELYIQKPVSASAAGTNGTSTGLGSGAKTTRDGGRRSDSRAPSAPTGRPSANGSRAKSGKGGASNGTGGRSSAAKGKGSSKQADANKMSKRKGLPRASPAAIDG